LAEYDGWIRNCARGSPQGCEVQAFGEELYLGSEADGRRYQSYLVFDTRQLPDEAVFTAVKFKVRSQSVLGTDPFKGGQRVRVEACSRDTWRSQALGASDYGSGRGCELIGFYRPVKSFGWFIFDIDPGLINRIDLTGIIRFRLSVESPRGSLPDRGIVKFYSGDADAQHRPVLIVRYDLP
jgi:hypothetical protein